MHAVVSIKQVPDTTNVRINPETGTLIREGVPAIVNPYDAHALELAVRLKERFGGKVRAPCVTRSGADFEVEADREGSLEVLYARGAIRNVGLQAMEHVVAVRREGGRSATSSISSSGSIHGR